MQSLSDFAPKQYTAVKYSTKQYRLGTLQYITAEQTGYITLHYSRVDLVHYITLHYITSPSGATCRSPLVTGHWVYCHPLLYCIALYCTLLYCTVLHCTVLYCTVLHCIVLYCTVLYCIVMYLYCTCTELYYTVQ